MKDIFRILFLITMMIFFITSCFINKSTEQKVDIVWNYEDKLLDTLSNQNNNYLVFSCGSRVYSFIEYDSLMIIKRFDGFYLKELIQAIPKYNFFKKLKKLTIQKKAKESVIQSTKKPLLAYELVNYQIDGLKYDYLYNMLEPRDELLFYIKSNILDAELRNLWNTKLIIY